MKISDFSQSNEHSWFCKFLGYEVEVNLEIEEEENFGDFENIVCNIEQWDSNFFQVLEPMLFAYYKDTIRLTGESELVIDSPTKIWKHIYIGELNIFSHDSIYYVLLSGNCDWEKEHGLEIDVNENAKVLYVGSFIGNGFRADPNKPKYYNYVTSLR